MLLPTLQELLIEEAVCAADAVARRTVGDVLNRSQQRISNLTGWQFTGVGGRMTGGGAGGAKSRGLMIGSEVANMRGSWVGAECSWVSLGQRSLRDGDACSWVSLGQRSLRDGDEIPGICA